MGKRQKNHKKHQTASERKDRLSKRQQRAKRNKELQKKWKDNLAQFRLQLQKSGLQLKEVEDDGNCLFRSISDQLYGDESHHAALRQEAVAYMIENEDNFAPFIEDDETFEEYIADMHKDAVWGGNMEIQALSMLYNFNVYIHQLDTAAFMIKNHFGTHIPTVHISYHLGEHYNSVRLQGDLTSGILKDNVMTIPEKLPGDVIKQPEQEKQQQKPKKKKTKAMRPKPGEETKMSTEAYVQSMFEAYNLQALKASVLSIFGNAHPSPEQLDSQEEALHKRYASIEAGIICSYLPQIEDDGSQGSLKKQLGQWFIRKRGIKILSKNNEWIDVVGPNKKCHCGSGSKYKICCLSQDFDLLEIIIASREQKKKEEPKEVSQGQQSVKEIEKKFDALYI